MAVAPPNMEEPIAPAKEEPDKPEGARLDQQQFNQDSREAMEKAYEEFNVIPEPEPEVVSATPAPDATPAPQDADKPPVVVIPEPAVEAPAPRTSFKSLEEADRAYLESRKKMNEATESAAQLRKDLEAAQRRADEAVNLVMRTAQQGGDRRGPAPASEPPAGMTKEELEAKFFEDPVGFMFSLTQAANQAAVKNLETRSKEERKRSAIEGLTHTTQTYFDEKFPDLKPIEALVTEEIRRVWNDPDTIRPIMEDKSKPIATKTKAVVEEAARRVRERLPEIMQGLAVQVSGTPTKERLVSGSPPLIPGSGRLAPVIRPDVSTKYGETNEEYLAGREKQRERMQATGRSR